jgi:hypothetical protein
VTLAFTVRSTVWALILLNRLVGLRDVKRWLERMNAVPADRAAFRHTDQAVSALSEVTPG